MRNDIIKRKQEILSWIDTDVSKAEIARRLSCNVKTLQSCLNALKIEYAGNKSGKGKLHDRGGTYMPFCKYVMKGSVQSNKLRNKLIREGFKEARCEICGNSKWNGKPIPLEVHHKDGDKNYNSLENLQLLCPNCHALTDNYRGKNIKSMRAYGGTGIHSALKMPRRKD